MMIMIMMRTIVAVVVSVCLAGQLGKRPGSAAQAHLPSQKPSNRPKILSRRFSVVRATRDKNFCEKTQWTQYTGRIGGQQWVLLSCDTVTGAVIADPHWHRTVTYKYLICLVRILLLGRRMSLPTVLCDLCNRRLSSYQKNKEANSLFIVLEICNVSKATSEKHFQ